MRARKDNLKIYNNEIYYYINKYNFSFGIIYKFANENNFIFCKQENGEFVIIEDKRTLKKIQKYFKKIKIRDIL